MRLRLRPCDCPCNGDIRAQGAQREGHTGESAVPTAPARNPAWRHLDFRPLASGESPCLRHLSQRPPETNTPAPSLWEERAGGSPRPPPQPVFHRQSDRDATPGGAFEAGTYRGLAGMVSAGAGRGLLQRHKLGEQPPGAQAGLGGIQLPLA